MSPASGMSEHCNKKITLLHLTFPWESEKRRWAHLQRQHGILLASDNRELTWTHPIQHLTLRHAGGGGLLLSYSVHTVMGNKQARPLLHSTFSFISLLYSFILHLEHVDWRVLLFVRNISRQWQTILFLFALFCCSVIGRFPWLGSWFLSMWLKTAADNWN